MAYHLYRQWLTGVIDDLRALLQHHFRVLRKKPDQLLAVGFQHVGAHERALADKIRLLLADRPGAAGIIRCDRPVRVLPDDDVADRTSTLLNSSHSCASLMPPSASQKQPP